MVRVRVRVISGCDVTLNMHEAAHVKLQTEKFFLSTDFSETCGPFPLEYRDNVDQVALQCVVSQHTHFRQR